MINTQQLRQRIAQVDGGELTDLPYPCSVRLPTAHSHAFIYTTKTRAASELFGSVDDGPSVGMIGRYGLPQDKDVSNIASIVRNHTVYFLGDCDPFDLLVFMWLRQHLSMRFLGISDAVVSTLGVNVSERITISLTDEEQRAMSLVRDIWPDFEGSVGPTCAKILCDNRKLELEALVSYRASPACNFLDTLQEPA